MPDIPKCGGLSECRKIANLAELYYMPFAPHNVSSPIGTLASAHVCATVPNFMVLEFHWLHRDYWTTIIQEKEDKRGAGPVRIEVHGCQSASKRDPLSACNRDPLLGFVMDVTSAPLARVGA